MGHTSSAAQLQHDMHCSSQVVAEEGLLRVDKWMVFRSPASIGALVRRLREQVDAALADKLSNPALQLTENKAVEAIMQLLSTDGF